MTCSPPTTAKKILLVGLLTLLSACASGNTRTTLTSTASSSTVPANTARTSLVSPETIRQYVEPEIPNVIAPAQNPHQQGGQGFIASTGQQLEVPYNVLCIDAAAQAAVEANIEYRDNMAQNSCAAAIRVLGARAARDLSLVDSAAATRENTLEAQNRAATDALLSTNRTVSDLREQLSSNTRFGTLLHVLFGVGGVVVGAGLAALILGLAN